MKPIAFLDAVAGYTNAGPVNSAGRPIKLATVDPSYDPFVDWPDQPPPARVTFEGETTLSTKAYAIDGGVIPMAGQRVWLVPIGNSYLIAGTLGTLTSQGFWQSEDGLAAGVEFGAASYYSDADGLVIAGDAAITGRLTVDGRDVGRGIVAVVQSSTNSATFGPAQTTVLTLSGVTLENGRAFRISHGSNVLAGSAIWVNPNVARVSSGANVYDWARSPIPATGTTCLCAGVGYISNATGSDITDDFILRMTFNAGTGSHQAGTNRKRFLMVEDVGTAADWPHATALV